jgi:hypothetical protein
LDLVSQPEMLKMVFPFNETAGCIQDFKKKAKMKQKAATKYTSRKGT